MKIPTLLWLCILTLACATPGFGSEPVSPQGARLPMGNRILEIGMVNTSQQEDFSAAFERAKALGIQSTSLSLYWDDLEPSPLTYTDTYLALANEYFPARGTAVSLVIATIDTVVKRLPSDLADRPFDDLVVIDRFKKLLGFIFSKIPDLDLTSLAIGNEIDGYLGQDETRWQPYRNFYEATRAHAQTLRSGLLVGTKGGFGGLTRDHVTHLQAMNRNSDVIMATYYPLNDDFTVRPLSVVRKDFKALSALYPGRPIYFSEIGYPTSRVCRSSEARQRRFIKRAFAAWDAHADQIRLMSFVFLTDLSQETVDELSNYYGMATPPFLEFLRTLGLRTYPGTGIDKMGLRTLAAEAAARGW